MIAICGSGAFGTALAISIAAKGTEVLLWARDADHVAEMATAGENSRRLPGLPFPATLRVTADITDIPADVPVLLSIPMQKLRAMMQEHAATLANRPLVACCKGVELSTGLGPTALIAELIPSATPAVLTGPSFAADIARGLPTAITLACADATLGATLQEQISTPTLRLYRTTDTTGAELGGALKNVIAIAAGTVMGAGLGDSARAAIMTRGYAEMQRMALALGAQAETLAGLSGFGDLTLTCTSDLSRNYRFGLSLGRGDGFDPAITVEGAATARAVLERAETMQIDMPITAAVVALLSGKYDLGDLINGLLSRPLKEE
jgi:glycerol-3-phosphate dehydrogenase (NAD(P)+)